MEITFIDHYDSFSFNVLEWLKCSGGPHVQITRITCDDHKGLDRLKSNLTPIVISPGPGKPSEYPRVVALIAEAMKSVPVLGICLGHQILGELAGGKIVKAKDPWHGTKATIQKKSEHWFTSGLSDSFQAVVYNSLVVDLGLTIPQDWQILGVDQIGQLMILAHSTKPICSVQFHPESFGSDDLTILAKNFFKKIS